MTAVASSFRFNLDPTNPGQFFACCGLLELADRLWAGGACGAFDENGRAFFIEVPEAGGPELGQRLLRHLAECTISNTMSAAERQRLDELSAMKKSALADAGFEDEKKALESLRREAPVVLGAPFSLTIDWHQDVRAGGSTFKTWAGQQSIIDIAGGMHALASVIHGPVESFLAQASRGAGLPFNFDSDLGAQGAALDVGFSFDPLPAMQIGVRPAIEFCAFVGLERFRPQRQGRDNRYRYCAWSDLLAPSVAAAAAAGIVRREHDPIFEFRLLYRTKYLKSFLPAKKV
jgi:CRISPR-associated protein Csb3